MRDGRLPRDLASGSALELLQRGLQRTGQHIPRVVRPDPEDFASSAKVRATSAFRLSALSRGQARWSLARRYGQMLPVVAGPLPVVKIWVDAKENSRLRVDVRTSDRPDNHTPDRVLATREIEVERGEGREITLAFDVRVDEPRYVFLCFDGGEALSLHLSEERLTGVLAVDAFEFWCPLRRPSGQNVAMSVEPPLAVFAPGNVVNPWYRPVHQPNAWLAALDDRAPAVTLSWNESRAVRTVDLFFDTDYDHPMESVLMGHPESEMPFCVRHYRLLDDAGRVARGGVRQPPDAPRAHVRNAGEHA